MTAPEREALLDALRRQRVCLTALASRRGLGDRARCLVQRLAAPGLERDPVGLLAVQVEVAALLGEAIAFDRINPTALDGGAGRPRRELWWA